jgi:hypothetical protein
MSTPSAPVTDGVAVYTGIDWQSDVGVEMSMCFLRFPFTLFPNIVWRLE